MKAHRNTHTSHGVQCRVETALFLLNWRPCFLKSQTPSRSCSIVETCSQSCKALWVSLMHPRSFYVSKQALAITRHRSLCYQLNTGTKQCCKHAYLLGSFNMGVYGDGLAASPTGRQRNCMFCASVCFRHHECVNRSSQHHTHTPAFLPYEAHCHNDFNHRLTRASA